MAANTNSKEIPKLEEVKAVHTFCSCRIISELAAIQSSLKTRFIIGRANNKCSTTLHSLNLSLSISFGIIFSGLLFLSSNLTTPKVT